MVNNEKRQFGDVIVHEIGNETKSEVKELQESTLLESEKLDDFKPTIVEHEAEPSRVEEKPEIEV